MTALPTFSNRQDQFTFRSPVTAATLVYSEMLKGGYVACLSEDLFDQYITAAVKEDKLALQYLLKNGCIITKTGIQVSVLDITWGTAKIRVYIGDSAVVEGIKNFV